MDEEIEKFLSVFRNELGDYGFSPVIAYALKFFLRNPYESLVIVDKNAKCHFLDKGSEKFFGLSEGGGKGMNVKELVPESDLPKVMKTRNPIIGNVIKVKGLRRIGSCYPIISDGEVIGGIGRLIFRSFEELDRINRQISHLKGQVKSLREKQRYSNRAFYSFENILGISQGIKDTIHMAEKIATTNSDALVIGESGTGKELFSQAIHNCVDPETPFVRVNSPAIPFELAESELFGYEKGAFSGASSTGKPGRFEIAHKGTIFFDELSSLHLSIQAKLLNVLEEREVQRLGGTDIKKLKFRLIATSNVDLRELVNQGRFRSDLYYRIAKATVYIPPLRERKDDIPIYIDHFLKKINERFSTHFKRLSDQAFDCFMSYNWPGNVRELINILEQACLKKWMGEEIPMSFLPPEITRTSLRKCYPVSGFKKEVNEKEKELILEALKKTGGNKRQASFLLGIPRSTLYKKLQEMNNV